MEAELKKKANARLKRIEGQVRGLVKMVEDERYCVDIITQISAVRAALKGVEKDILKNHIGHCVAGAFRGGDVRDQQTKITELADLMADLTR